MLRALSAWPSLLMRSHRGGLLLSTRPRLPTWRPALPAPTALPPALLALHTHCRALHHLCSLPGRLAWHLPAAQQRHRRASVRAPSSSVITRAHASYHLPKAGDIIPQEHQEYWRGVLEGVDKPSAVKLLPHVDPAFLLGLHSFEKRPASGSSGGEAGAAAGGGGGGGGGGLGGPGKGRRKTPPVLSYFAKTKAEHPTKVLLVRVGEFFESVGIDAILLVQYAGLNPMGQGDPPRAGCPRANLRRTVADLVNAGLSVVVCEEVMEPYTYGYKRTNTKERYVAKAVSPSMPHLVYGLIDEDADVEFDSTPPLLGVSSQVGGFTVVEVNVELFKVTVTEGLTEDAVYARMYEGGLSPPLYIHVPAGSSDGAIPPWERRLADTFRRHTGSVERYTGDDPVASLLAKVRQSLELPPGANFITVSSSATDQPRPLYHSTASNLGLHTNRGVPPLLDSLVPPSTPSASRAWLRQLLLFPPPPKVGAAVLAACRQLADLDAPVPIFPAIGVTNVVLKLSQREANDIFFRELATLCLSITEACTTPVLAELSDALLVAAAHSTGLFFPRSELAAACSEVLAAIRQVVEEEERVAGSGLTEYELAEGFNAAADVASEALGRLRVANENKFRGRVQNSVIPREHQAVESAWEEVEASVREMMQNVTNFLAQHNSSASAAGSKPSSSSQSSPSLVYNSVNNAVWLKLPRGVGAAAAKALEKEGLKHPIDRLGNTESGFYSTQKLEAAQNAYRRACAEAAEAVKAQLKELSGRVQAQLPPLVTACMFAAIATALNAHMHEAKRRGWELPTQAYPPDLQPRQLAAGGEGGNPGGDLGGNQIDIRGMWPYWLDGKAQSVVLNDCSMEGLFLLTGPNMAGKSTLLRTLCAVCLLGACGLAAPARSATVPYLDAFMLRNFSADSPVDGRSSFAVEMTEMRYVLNDVTPRSLVLVDELGKGTEVRAGAALAGAMLEELARIGCKGVFATHLHVLLDMDLRLPGVQLQQMEVQPNPACPVGGLRATLRMIPGSSRESLALEVARDCNLPEEVLQRAAELYSGMHTATYGQQGEGSSAAAAEAEEGQQQQQQQGEQRRRRQRGWALENGSGSGAESGSSGEEEEGDGGLGQQEAAPVQLTIQDAGQVLASTAAHVLASLLNQQQQHQAQEQIAAQQQLQELELVQPAASLAASSLANGAGQVLGGSRDASTQQAQQPQQAQQAQQAQQQQQVQVQFVGPRQGAPARTVGCACVYVVRREDGYFYVGSTDALQQRITAHRRRKPSSSSRVGGGPGIEVAYIALAGGAGGASTAKTIEAALIRELAGEGFPLLSTSDARKKHKPKFE